MDTKVDVVPAIKTKYLNVFRKLMKDGGPGLCEYSYRGRNGLHWAVELGSRKLVRRVLEKCPSLINTKARKTVDGVDGYTALHFAAARGDVRIGKLLLKKGALVSEGSMKKVTPLHLAVNVGCRKFMKVLIRNSCDMDACDCEKITPLLSAVLKDNVSIVRFLIMKGASIKGNIHLLEIIGVAVNNGSVKVVKFLMRNFNLNMNQPIQYGRTLLHLCVLPKDLFGMEFVGSLLKRDRTSRTVRTTKLRILKVLLQYDLDINVKCTEGLTVLHYAAAVGYHAIVRCLLEVNNYVCLKCGNCNKVIDLDAKSRTGKTALFYAVENRNVNVVETLISCNAKMKYFDFYGRPLLQVACDSGHGTIINMVLEKLDGTESFQRDYLKVLESCLSRNLMLVVGVLLRFKGCVLSYKNGKVVVDVGNLDVELIRLLLKSCNYVVNILNVEQVLNVAIRNDYRDIADVCLRSVSNLNWVNEDGDTLLMVACDKGNVEVGKRLIELGCDVKVVNRSNCNNALHLAAVRFVPELVELLIGKGCNLKALNYKLESPFMGFLKSLVYWSKIGDPVRNLEDKRELEKVVKVTKMFLSGMGSEFDCMHFDDKNCVLLCAVRTGIGPLVDLVVRAMPDVKVHRDESTGRGPVHLAAAYGYMKVLIVLIKTGFDMDYRDLDGEPPYVYAIRCEQVNAVKLLVKFSDCTQYRDSVGRTPLHIAVETENQAMVSNLIMAGLNVHAHDFENKTPLCYAVLKNYEDIIYLFFERGFNINTLDGAGILRLLRNPCSLNLMKRHFVLCSAAKFHINPQLVKMMPLKKKNVLYGEYFNNCVKEVDRLNNSIIEGTRISYMDVLTASDNRLAAYGNNPDFCKLMSQIDYIQTKFPNYWWWMFSQINKSQVRSGLVRRCCAIFEKCPSTLNVLPLSCFYLVLEYLSNEDLQVFSTIESYYCLLRESN